ncbi:MAG: T9SS type A sorting domain-containing protein [Melioribacteraceae bacterium]|nr:T9SS type A sorting domain-containing protein [Melioribacteraceae bacterium]
MFRIVLYLIVSITLFAQTKDAIFVNNIYLPFDNKGVLADVSVPPFGQLGIYDNTGFLFSGGFYLTGYADGELFANGVVTSAIVTDYQPGKVGSEPDDSTNIIYKVSVDSEPFGEEWQKWSYAVDQGAYFYDGDGNGIYSPIDHNKNGIWDSNEDRPDIFYDETYFTVFNDGVEDNIRRWRVKPLGIEIGQTVFASARNTKLSNTVFVRYRIKNTGLVADTLKDVIFTFYQDPDIGEHNDDQHGIDTTLQSSFAYDDDNHDTQYGIPPAAFFTIIQTPKTFTGNANDFAINRMGPDLGEELFQYHKNVKIITGTGYRKSSVWFGEPNTSQEARNYAEALTRYGDPVDPCSSRFGVPDTYDPIAIVNCMDCEDVNPMFWLSGDPVTNCGWLGINTTDIRNLLSAGYFNLIVDEPTDIIVAYTIDRGGDGMESITKTRERVSYLLEEYERNFSTIVSVDDKHEEVVNEFSLSQNYPNPFNPSTTIKFTVPSDVKRETSITKLVVYDILGREIKTLVNEVKAPGTYEVTFNASQLASGVYFYRLQSGSFIKTKKMVLLR